MCALSVRSPLKLFARINLIRWFFDFTFTRYFFSFQNSRLKLWNKHFVFQKFLYKNFQTNKTKKKYWIKGYAFEYPHKKTKKYIYFWVSHNLLDSNKAKFLRIVPFFLFMRRCKFNLTYSVKTFFVSEHRYFLKTTSAIL